MSNKEIYRRKYKSNYFKFQAKLFGEPVAKILNRFNRIQNWCRSITTLKKSINYRTAIGNSVSNLLDSAILLFSIRISMVFDTRNLSVRISNQWVQVLLKYFHVRIFTCFTFSKTNEASVLCQVGGRVKSGGRSRKIMAPCRQQIIN